MQYVKKLNANVHAKMSAKVKKVYSEIRILLYFAIAILTLSTISANAQSQEQALDDAQQQAAESANTQSEQTQTPTQNIDAGQPILRLEDTIRGNKEQPQVLTIVPWQLPVHQRINENSEWQLQVKPLNSIERSAFLRNLAVVNEIKQSQEDESPENIE